MRNKWLKLMLLGIGFILLGISVSILTIGRYETFWMRILSRGLPALGITLLLLGFIWEQLTET